jgi:hypothetical protein
MDKEIEGFRKEIVRWRGRNGCTLTTRPGRRPPPTFTAHTMRSEMRKPGWAQEQDAAGFSEEQRRRRLGSEGHPAEWMGPRLGGAIWFFGRISPRSHARIC